MLQLNIFLVGYKLKKNYYLEISILALAVLIASINEILPSGVLPIIAEHFNVSVEDAGYFTGIHAIGSALVTIPLASLTMHLDRKKLFVAIVTTFAISSFGFVFAPNFKIALLFRLMAGIACGAFWPMVSAFAIKISPLNMRSRSIPIIMFGGTLGVSFGVPFLTRLGLKHGWEFEFLIFAFFTLTVVFLAIFFLSKTPGEMRTKNTSFVTMVKNRHVITVTLATVFAVFAHYGSYVYHTVILEHQMYPAEVDFALTIYGIGSMVSIISAAILSHKFLRSFNIAIIFSGVASMLMMRFFPSNFFILNSALVLWGITNGSLSPAMQTAISKNVEEGLSNAISIQSCAFNFSIMFATAASGAVLKSFGVNSLLIMCAIAFSMSLAIIIFSKKTFRN